MKRKYTHVHRIKHWANLLEHQPRLTKTGHFDDRQHVRWVPWPLTVALRPDLADMEPGETRELNKGK